jgi:hypothetical protein
MSEEKIYTEQEFKTKILENNQSHLFKSIDRLDNSINSLNNKIDTFKYWTLGLIFGLYGLMITYFVTK